MRILVTGSAGHLGEALMRSLRAEGRDVVGIDLLPSPWTDVVGDIADRAMVEECMRGMTHVLHTATLHKPHVNTHTRELLGWRPRYDFASALRSLAAGKDYRSPIALAIGSKGYHRVA